MFARYCTRAIPLVVLVLASAGAHADDDLAKLVQQLDSDKFSERQAASEELAKRGVEAIPALTEAATSDSREVSMRALELLKRHFDNGDNATKQAAREALQKLADGGQGSVARRAQQVLDPAPTPADDGQGIFRPRAPIRVQVVAAVGARRMTVRVVNGVKDIEVDENGQKFKIHDDPNNGIQVEITEKKGDKEETKKFEAKNAEELKQKHPEAHKVYEKYSQQGGGVQIRAAAPLPNALPLLPQPEIAPPQFAPPIAPPPVPQIPRPAPVDRTQQFEESKKHIDEMIERVKQQAQQNGGNAEHYRRLIDQLEKHKQRLDEVKQQLDEATQRIDAQRALPM